MTTAAATNTASLVESYARGATDVPLIEQTIGAFFADMVARQPDREALVSVHQGRRYTYAQLQTEAHRLASALLGLGLVPGDRVGIWSHNNAEWVLMQLATAQVGLVLVNINPAYRTAEVEYALNKVGCKLLVTMARFKTSDYLGMLRELAPEWAHGTPGALEAQQLPHLHTVVWIDAGLGVGGDEPGLLRFSRSDRARQPGRPAPGPGGSHAEGHRPHQHPVHQRHHGLPQGRHAHAPQHPEQRLLHWRVHEASRPKTGCAFPCRCTTALAWCWATWRASRTALPSCTPMMGLTR